MRIHGKDSLFTLASAAHWCPPGAVLSVLSVVFSFGSFPWVTSWPPQAIWARTVLVQASRKGEDLLLNHVLSFVSTLWPWRLLGTGGLRQFPRPPWWPELPAVLAKNKLLASLWEICNSVGLGRGLQIWNVNKDLKWSLSSGKFGTHCSGMDVGKLNTPSTKELRSLLALVFQPVHSAWLALIF